MIGGAGRDRTDDILLAKQALSQLSYGPKPLELVGLGGLEPPTSRLSSARSNQLSYKPWQEHVQSNFIGSSLARPPISLSLAVAARAAPKTKGANPNHLRRKRNVDGRYCPVT